jgi:hypothetical protein
MMFSSSAVRMAIVVTSPGRLGPYQRHQEFASGPGRVAFAVSAGLVTEQTHSGYEQPCCAHHTCPTTV